MPVSGPQYMNERRGKCEKEEQIYQETRGRFNKATQKTTWLPGMFSQAGPFERSEGPAWKSSPGAGEGYFFALPWFVTASIFFSMVSGSPM